MSAFVTAVLNDSRYAEPLIATVDGALGGDRDEYRAIAAWHDDAIVGLVVFGATAGALGAGRVYLIAVDAISFDPKRSRFVTLLVR